MTVIKPSLHKGELVKIPVSVNRTIPALTHATRCDSCGAKAWAAARFKTGSTPLYFCGHHFTEWELAIRAKAVEVVDERDKLTASVKAQKAENTIPPGQEAAKPRGRK